MTTEYRFIDLFCGIGGFHIALTKLGMQCVYACDLDKNCRESYEKNHKRTLNYKHTILTL